MKQYAKSILGGLIAALSFAIPVVDNGLTPSEVLGIVLAGLTGLGVVYVVPNKPAE
ncbi:MAG: hypothetical protein ACXVXP_00020 [Mycobacteriaceae bacterium]